MEQLIWCTIPGALLVTALVIPGFWLTRDTSGWTAITICTAPVVGLVMRETFRCLFNTWFRFRLPRWRVLGSIMRTQGDCSMGAKDAFVIWECGLCSDTFPAAFRDHLTRSMDRMFAYGSVSFAALCGLPYLLFGEATTAAVVYVGVALAFACLGHQLWQVLDREQARMFEMHRNVFRSTSRPRHPRRRGGDDRRDEQGADVRQ